MAMVGIFLILDTYFQYIFIFLLLCIVYLFILFHEALLNCKKGATTEVNAQEPSIWAKGCIVGDCASVIGFDMTTPP